MDKKKKDRLYSLLEKRGIQRASDYYDGDKTKKPKYKDIVDVVPGAKRISNDFGEIVYRKLNVPVSDDPQEEEIDTQPLPERGFPAPCLALFVDDDRRTGEEESR